MITIDLIVSTAYILLLAKQYSELLRDHKIKNVRIKKGRIEATYLLDAVIGEIPLDFSVRPEVSPDATELWLTIEVEVGPGTQPASRGAAGQIAKMFRKHLPEIYNHGGTVILPLEKYAGGLTVSMIDEELRIKIRL